jgi:hypothetical protein
LLTIYYRRFPRTPHLEEDQEPLLDFIRLEYYCAALEVKIGHLETVVAYPRSDLDCEIQRLEDGLASVNIQLS